MSDNIKIKVRSLSKAFKDRKILDGVDLDIKTGSSLVILGPSGTGKSVLIKTIIGLLDLDAGSIEIDGANTANFSTKQYFKFMEKCGFLFQSSALFDSLTVQENIVFFAQRLKSLSAIEKRDLAAEMLEAVGLSSEILDSFPAELSGGMQKRVSLARAISINPEIVFFDEPTTGLDPIMANVINDLIIKIRQKLGATTVTITHDLISANLIATDIAMLVKGKIIWEGDVKEFNSTNDSAINQFKNGLINGPILV